MRATKQWTTDTQVREWMGGISPSTQEDSARLTDAERESDGVYADDFATMAVIFTEDLKHRGKPKTYARITRVLIHGAQLSEDQPIEHFRASYGDAATLRCLARAVEANQ